MRSILSLSLPLYQKKKIQEKAKKVNKTISNYILSALNLLDELISEDELLQMSKKAEKDYREGKTKKLESLGNLMQ